MESINFYITLITFIPWIFLFMITIINTLNKSDEEFSINYLKHHLLKIFRIDLLILIGCFFYFASFKKGFVNKYLFPVMCIYLLFNSFYENKKKLEKNFFKNNIINLIILFFIMLLPIIFYLMFRKLSLTYKIMFIMLFLEYFIVWLVKLVTKTRKKIID